MCDHFAVWGADLVASMVTQSWSHSIMAYATAKRVDVLTNRSQADQSHRNRHAGGLGRAGQEKVYRHMSHHGWFLRSEVRRFANPSPSHFPAYSNGNSQLYVWN